MKGFMTSMFRAVKPEDIAAAELFQAKIDLLSCRFEEEFFQSRGQMLEQRISRLEQYLSAGKPVEVALRALKQQHG